MDMMSVDDPLAAPGGLWVLGDRVRLVGQLPGRAVDLIEVTVPPGSGTPPHTHASPELFHVTEGEITVGRFGAGPPAFETLGPGGAAAVAGGDAHNYSNRGNAPARMLVLVEPAMTAFFRELGRPVPPPPGPPDATLIEMVGAACTRHGITLVA